jgi:hypothetical protein
MAECCNVVCINESPHPINVDNLSLQYSLQVFESAIVFGSDVLDRLAI